MKRAIGKYRDEDITIAALHLAETYAGLLMGSRSDKWLNIERVNVTIDKEAGRLFGSHIPYCITNYNEIDYSKPLLPEIVYTYLTCSTPIKKWDGSHLVLVWMQEDGCDPFTMSIEKLKTIDWEKHAIDFQY